MATKGLKGPSSSLPHLDQIQHSFGGHDVSGVKAHVGGAAKTASEGMGARAYATGDSVAFKSAPDLHTAAHEAAHVVQQKAGVNLSGGVGKAGDRYEQRADMAAQAVVQGNSAEALLGPIAGANRNTHDIQRVEEKTPGQSTRNPVGGAKSDNSSTSSLGEDEASPIIKEVQDYLEKPIALSDSKGKHTPAPAAQANAVQSGTDGTQDEANQSVSGDAGDGVSSNQGNEGGENSTEPSLQKSSVGPSTGGTTTLQLKASRSGIQAPPRNLVEGAKAIFNGPKSTQVGGPGGADGNSTQSSGTSPSVQRRAAVAQKNEDVGTPVVLGEPTNSPEPVQLCIDPVVPTYSVEKRWPAVYQAPPQPPTQTVCAGKARPYSTCPTKEVQIGSTPQLPEGVTTTGWTDEEWMQPVVAQGFGYFSNGSYWTGVTSAASSQMEIQVAKEQGKKRVLDALAQDQKNCVEINVAHINRFRDYLEAKEKVSTLRITRNLWTGQLEAVSGMLTGFKLQRAEQQEEDEKKKAEKRVAAEKKKADKIIGISSTIVQSAAYLAHPNPAHFVIVGAKLAEKALKFGTGHPAGHFVPAG